MNEQNTKRIIEACPSLFESMDFHNESVVFPISFYFECHDGWADLLVELCENIQKHLNTMPKDMVRELVALQVKEKYGTLRFYISGYDETLDKLIVDAEEKSATICEMCGKPGKVRGSLWLYTACDEHTQENDLKAQSHETP